MKVVSINPASAAVGGMLTVLTLFSAGAMQLPAFVRVGITNAVQVEGIARPQDMVVIREGEPFVVPEGKLFVLTALGVFDTSGSASLAVDGQHEIRALPSAGNVIGAYTSIHPVPTGFTAPAGKTLSISNGIGQGRAWGYLVDA